MLHGVGTGAVQVRTLLGPTELVGILGICRQDRMMERHVLYEGVEQKKNAPQTLKSAFTLDLAVQVHAA